MQSSLARYIVYFAYSYRDIVYSVIECLNGAGVYIYIIRTQSGLMKHELLQGWRAGGATRSAMAGCSAPLFISSQSIGHTGTSNRGFVFLGDS